MDLQEQRFGVEIEFSGITRDHAASIIANHFGTQSEYYGGTYYTYVIKDASDRKWKIMRDASLTTYRTTPNG